MSEGEFPARLNSHMVIRRDNFAMFQETCLNPIEISSRIGFQDYLKKIIIITGIIRKLCKLQKSPNLLVGLQNMV